MRVLILTHPRSGGLSLMNYIGNELNYTQYHEPFNDLTEEDINTKVLIENNIVVKDFPNHIINKGYDINDVVSKFDRIIIHHRGNHRDVAISLTYFQYGYGNKLHETYNITDEWIKDNEKGIQEITVDTEQMFYFLQNTESNDCIRTTYDGIYMEPIENGTVNDKSDIPRLLKYLNIYNPLYLDILDKRHKLQNGDIGMEDVKVKPKLI
jgi:hypothetical protein